MNEPNYNNYTLDELYDARSNIDADLFPDRLRKINIFISQKEKLLKNTTQKIEEVDSNKTKPKKKIIGIVLVLSIFIFTHIGIIIFGKLNRKENKFRNATIHSKIDSIVFRKMTDLKKHHILTDGKWYSLPAGYYTEFVRFIIKGDSISKSANRWDVYIYRKTNKKIVEKYFEGAQGYWE